jgi:protein SCO1
MDRRVLVLLAALLAAASCSSAKRYEMRGQILAVNRDRMEILVKHEEIPGLMSAMTMPWKVRTAGMLDNLGPGDLITSEIELENNQGVVTKITKLGTAKPDVPAPGAPAKPGVKYLVPGDAVPNQAFIDQEGRARDFTSLQGGRAMAVTFIYTQCPVPTYCPMMDRQFAEAQALITQKGLGDRARLLSVSFDPKNDTPAVMKHHARKLKFDPNIWTFVTGGREEIDRFATSFGVTLIRGEAANPDEIGHTLRTALVGRDGRLVKTYGGGDWTPEQLVADLEQLP